MKYINSILLLTWGATGIVIALATTPDLILIGISSAFIGAGLMNLKREWDINRLKLQSEITYLAHRVATAMILQSRLPHPSTLKKEDPADWWKGGRFDRN